MCGHTNVKCAETTVLEMRKEVLRMGQEFLVSYLLQGNDISYFVWVVTLNLLLRQYQRWSVLI